jgi:hypothetical protein
VPRNKHFKKKNSKKIPLTPNKNKTNKATNKHAKKKPLEDTIKKKRKRPRE